MLLFRVRHLYIFLFIYLFPFSSSSSSSLIRICNVVFGNSLVLIGRLDLRKENNYNFNLNKSLSFPHFSSLFRNSCFVLSLNSIFSRFSSLFIHYRFQQERRRRNQQQQQQQLSNVTALVCASCVDTRNTATAVCVSVCVTFSQQQQQQQQHQQQLQHAVVCRCHLLQRSHSTTHATATATAATHRLHAQTRRVARMASSASPTTACFLSPLHATTTTTTADRIAAQDIRQKRRDHQSDTNSSGNKLQATEAVSELQRRLYPQRRHRSSQQQQSEKRTAFRVAAASPAARIQSSSAATATMRQRVVVVVVEQSNRSSEASPAAAATTSASRCATPGGVLGRAASRPRVRLRQAQVHQQVGAQAAGRPPRPQGLPGEDLVSESTHEVAQQQGARTHALIILNGCQCHTTTTAANATSCASTTNTITSTTASQQS